MFNSLFINKLNVRINEVSEHPSIFVHYLCERFGLLIQIAHSFFICNKTYVETK